MKIEELHIGQEVRHPNFDGIGNIKSLSPTTAEILFNVGKIQITDIEQLVPADPHFVVTQSLKTLIQEVAAITAQKTIEAATTEIEIAKKWIDGNIIMQPKDTTLQAKELQISTLFHKIVMIRDNLRVLEQKVNTHEKLNDADRIELQQYITKAYGSLTTFNHLFKEKADQI